MRSLLLKGVLAVGILWTLLTGFWTAAPFLRAKEGVCTRCRGAGFHRNGRVELSCEACSGTGGRYSFGKFLDRYGNNLLEGRSAFLGGFIHRPAEKFVNVLLVLHVCMLAWLARLVECPFCRGVGRVAVVVDLQDGGSRDTEQFCAGCGGSGQGTELDRWAVRLAKER